MPAPISSNADWSGSGLAGAEETTQFLIDMHKAGVTPPVGSMGTQEQFDLFKVGKIAICHGETPQIGDLIANPPGFEWDVAYAPPGPKGQTVIGNFGILASRKQARTRKLPGPSSSIGRRVRKLGGLPSRSICRSSAMTLQRRCLPRIRPWPRCRPSSFPRSGHRTPPKNPGDTAEHLAGRRRSLSRSLDGKQTIEKMSEVTNTILKS